MTSKQLTAVLLLGQIHEVEVFPFVVLPYGYGNGWTPGAGR